MIIALTIFSILVYVVVHYNTNIYCKFVDDFINFGGIDFQKFNKDKYEILFCTKEQLQKDCKTMFKFYINNKCNRYAKEIKIICDEKSCDNGALFEFFKKYDINHIPNITFLDNGKKINSIALRSEDEDGVY